ncbi:flagellar hook-length control protein FliK [Sphingomonas kyeonggiensis]|uniref:flagellar hook-length control protein FliK n=1 Tax=Sphingomonas kyeonggiensis TaxID=1268553 RepID=UPI002781D881|nr:flagellar hook-length control protein FliK [Sphingomonas kyeonggiensis]MDQ0248483.1 flagellar hook-length control protein FliK [Sphingomonas kyeonggiensis]
MIHLTIALPGIAVDPAKPNAAISVDVSGFALAMGALMPKIAAHAAAPQGKLADAAIALPKGQDLAGDGKELPDAVLGLDGKGEEQPGSDTDDKEDATAEDAPPPAFAWFAVTPPVASPEAKAEAVSDVTVETGGKRAGGEAQLPVGPIAETGKAAPEAKAEVPKPIVTPTTATATTPAPAILPEARPQPVPRNTAGQPKVAASAVAVAPADPVVEAPMAGTGIAPAAISDTATDTTPQPILAQPPRELRQAAAEAPVVRITTDKPAPQEKLSIADVTPAPLQPAPTATVPPSPSVADQIFAAFDRPATRAVATSTSSDPQIDLSTLAAPATGAQSATAVAATGQGQDVALDMRHQEWTSKMIDRIETLQGAGPARETRLSLMPEALGKVDIAIRQDDSGSIHVQFNTDTQSARQLIADAQPKLAEIAQERGIRLGSTSVESNATGTGAGNANPQMNQGQRQDAAPNRHQPSAPPGARREAQTSTQDDERIA